MRRRTFLGVSTLVLLTSPAFGQAPAQQPRRQPAPRANAAAPAPTQVQAPAAAPAQARVPDPAEMDRLMAAWEKQSARLDTLDVAFVRTDKSPGWGENDEYQGHAYVQKPNLACLHFQKVIREPGQKPRAEDHERIICDGTQVRQYSYPTHQIFVFPLARDQRKRALQEGPLPFLFNTKAAELRARYEMALIGENDVAFLIRILPRLEEDRKVFGKAMLQLSKKTYLPDRLLLVALNDKDTQDYRFSDVKANQPVKSQLFVAADIKGWDVIQNPTGEATSPGPAPAATDPRVAAPAGRVPANARGGAAPTRRNQ